MGCGASKAAQVDESAITIQRSQDRPAAKDNVTGVEDVKSEGVLSQPEVAEPTTTPPPLEQNENAPQPSTSVPSPTADTSSLPLPNEVSSPLPKPIAYEIPLNEEGKPMARKPFARRLEKLENAPKVTAESLAEKQRKAEERKLKELAKRKGGSKHLSRMKRDIIAARNADIYNEVERKITNASLNQGLIVPGSGEIQTGQHSTRNKHKVIRPGEGEFESGSYNLSVDMEVDNTFNADSNGEDVWGSSHTSNPSQPMQLSLNGQLVRADTSVVAAPSPQIVHYSTIVT